MSTYDDSSLFLYPSGYKASVLFAQKPMDANGQLAFTRSNDTATRVASNGLIEKVRTNLILQSQAFNTFAWTLVTSGTGITPIVTANNATAPDGTMTADTIVFNTGAGTTTSDISIITQSATIGSQTYSGSFYARVASGTGQLVFRHAAGGTYTTANLTTTWQRFSSTETGSSNFEIGIRRGLSNEPINASVTVQIWGAQLETGDIATDYIATTTAAVSVGPVANIPRIDYLGGGCGKLLLEPQRTNTILWSEQINTTKWPSSTRINVTENALVSPDGYQNADVIIPNTTSGNHGPAQNVSGLTSGATYSCSIYAKAQGYSKFLILAGAGTGSGQYEFDLNAGTAQAGATITSVGNGWYRCTAPLVPNSSLLQYLIFISNGSAYSYAGNGTSGIALWGAQLEAGAYATSYIPTLAASVTRGADACSKTGISSLIGQTEGTLFVEMKDLVWTASSLRLIGISDGSFSNRVIVLNGVTSNTLRVIVSAGGVSQASTTQAATFGNMKIALAYSSAGAVVYVNGTQLITTSAITVPATSAVYLGMEESGSSTSQPNGTFAQATLFKTRLPNSELAALTTL